MIGALLHRGADVRCREKFGRTPIHIWFVALGQSNHACAACVCMHSNIYAARLVSVHRCDREDIDNSFPEKVVPVRMRGTLSVTAPTQPTPVCLFGLQLFLEQYPRLVATRTFSGAMPLHLAISRGRMAVCASRHTQHEGLR